MAAAGTSSYFFISLFQKKIATQPPAASRFFFGMRLLGAGTVVGRRAAARLCRGTQSAVLSWTAPYLGLRLLQGVRRSWTAPFLWIKLTTNLETVQMLDTFLPINPTRRVYLLESSYHVWDTPTRLHRHTEAPQTGGGPPSWGVWPSGTGASGGLWPAVPVQRPRHG